MRLLSSTNKLWTVQRLPRGSSRLLVGTARVCSFRTTKSQLPLHYWRASSSAFAQQQYARGSFRSFSSVATAMDNDSGESEAQTTTIPFNLADIGEGIAEVELLQWFVAPGDTVAQFDRICEVQSDKATVEITSRFDGVVESLSGNVGDMISVGSPLLYISVAGADSTTSSRDTSSSETTTPQTTPTLHNVDDEEDKLHIPSVASKFHITGDDNVDEDASDASQKQKVLATPAVRKIGMDYGLDLSTIMGTGPKGRVLKADVLKLLKESGRYREETPTPQQQQQPTEAPTTTAASPQAAAIDVVSGQDTTVPIRGYNRLMVKSMTASLQIPQMVYGDEVEMNTIRKCREELKPLAESHGVKLSFLPFAIKAASLAMKEYPVLNSSINAEEYELTHHGNHNIGVAMDTARGLAVPVVKSCQDRSVLDIAKELTRLQLAASEGNLSESDISDATFTLSNIGAIGGTYMSPIVSPPQVAIGAMGRVQRLVRFVGNDEDIKVEEVHVMQISWGGDHRVIDGATMARFSNQWKSYMESPMTMVFSLK